MMKEAITYPSIKEHKKLNVFISYNQLSPLTYDLRYPNLNSKVFYKDLENFTDYFIPIMQDQVGWIVEKYISYLKKNKSEKLRTTNEYLLETLIAGVYWNNYSPNISSVNYIILKSSSFLFKIRSFHPLIKKWADLGRGALLNQMLYSPVKQIEPSLKAFEKLILWLEASGDFKNEVERLKNLLKYLKTLSSDETELVLNLFISLSNKFNERSKLFLGFYTQKVEEYLKYNQFTGVSGREDQILCNRQENDYHLNMFASELLNRQLREDFLSKSNKIVLLPTCMSQKETPCRSKNSNGYLECTLCSRNCSVGQITEELKKHNVATCLIPHNSSFEKLLKQWKGQKNIGLVGIACALNILGGGYEMIRLQIASQCVLLNYSGCKKHWHPKGINTGIDLIQLKKILNIV